MEYLKNVFYGMMIGIANVVPGVSGGTIAVIFNIYDKLLESVTLNIKVLKRNFSFLFPLAFGVLFGIVGVSKLMKYLLENYPMQTYSGFIGVIIGSLPLIIAKVKEAKTVKKKNYIFFVVSVGLMVFLALYNADKETAKELIKYTTLNFESFVVCFLAMSIATITMIIPGISGSLLLIIMGMYGTIYGYAVAEFYIPLLIPIGLGAVISLLLGAKLVRVLLSKFHQQTYLAILGLLIGSIFQLIIISGLNFSLSYDVLTSAVVMIICMLLVYATSVKEIKSTNKQF
ncbi:MAG: DUF368 domain-containing protein [Anaerorhabdus sp.]